MKLKEITSYLESIAPKQFQESYDNSGLILGDNNQDVSSVLVSIDVTEDIIDEAVELKANLIVSHHPILFTGLKKITGSNYIERVIQKAIKNDIAIYTMHTNLDNIFDGVNREICRRLNLKNCKILRPLENNLYKLVTFIPNDSLKKVQEAVFNSGAGKIGNYDSCSYNLEGYGTFRAGNDANPYVGEIGKIHKESEIRFETIFPKYLKSDVIAALLQAHPYEEVAYDIYSLVNNLSSAGAGMIGELEDEIEELEFLNSIKNIFNTSVVRYTKLLNRKIEKVAVCGGSGSFLLNDAIRNKADIFISSDFKYHQFFDAEDKLIIADIGHYESEQYTKEIIYNLLIKKIATFAVHLSKINTNPINYL